MNSVFVSSTFKDMQGERDTVHRRVLPALRDAARSRNESVRFIDLRWGISTSELESDEAQRKILDVCLREIDACAPFMLVLLGERYGWIPDEELITASAQRAGFALEKSRISVTELEIRYGVHRTQEQIGNILFCFREIENPDDLPEDQRSVYISSNQADRERMRQLKESISSQPGAHIVRYSLRWDKSAQRFSGYDDFADRITEELYTIISRTWSEEEELPWLVKQRAEDKMIRQNLISGFVGLEDARKEYLKAISKNQVILFEGESGCGKSAMLTRLLYDLRKLCNVSIVYCGASFNCMNTLQLIKILIYRLTRNDKLVRQEEKLDIFRIRDLWNQLCEKIEKEYTGKPIVLFIDAIDQLYPDEALLQSWFIPAKIPKQMRIVISTNGSVTINRSLLTNSDRYIPFEHIRMLPPSALEKKKILLSLFNREHKQLPEAVLIKLTEHPLSGNMLCADMMVKWLSGLYSYDFRQIGQLEEELGDGSRAIETYLIRQIDEMPEEIDSFIYFYIVRMGGFLNDVSPTNAVDTCNTLIPLVFISMTLHGLTRDQLEQAQQRASAQMVNERSDHPLRHFWDELVFSRMRAYMDAQLVDRPDGRVDFAHRLMRESLAKASVSSLTSWVMKVLLLYEPVESETKQEDLFRLLYKGYYALVYYDRNPDILPDSEAYTGYLESAYGQLSLLYYEISEKAESEDEKERLRWEAVDNRVLMSMVSDLSHPECADFACRLIDYAVKEKKAASMDWCIYQLIQCAGELRQRTLPEEVSALRIFVALIRAFARENDLSGENWTQPCYCRLMQICYRGMNDFVRLYGELAEKRHSLFRDAAEIETVYQDIQKLFDAMEPLIDEKNRFLFLFRKACVEAQMAIHYATENYLSRRFKKAVRTVNALKDQMLLLRDVPYDEYNIDDYYGFLVVQLSRAYFKRWMYNRVPFKKNADSGMAEKMIDECMRYLAEKDYLKYKYAPDVWLELVNARALLYCYRNDIQPAANLLWKWYDYYKDSSDMDRMGRSSLCNVGLQLSWLVRNRYCPDTFKAPENDYEKYRLCKNLISRICYREHNFITSSPQNNNDWLGSYILLQCAEIFTMDTEDHTGKLSAFKKIKQDIHQYLLRETKQDAMGHLLLVQQQLIWVNERIEYYEKLVASDASATE